jgi:hypothetical protein
MNPYNINALGGFNPDQAIAGLGQQFRQNRMQDEAMAKQQQQEQQAKQQQEQTQKLYMAASKGDPEAVEQLYGLGDMKAQFFEKRNQERLDKVGAAQSMKEKKARIAFNLDWIQADNLERKQELLQDALVNPLIDIDEDDIGGDEMQNDLAIHLQLRDDLGQDVYKDIIINRGQAGSDTNFAPTVSALQTDPKTGQQYTVITDRNSGQSVRKNVDGAIAQTLEQEQDMEFRGKSLNDSRELSKEMFGELRGVKSQIGTINEAIKAIDDGASSGAFDKYLPSFRESTIALENAAQRMGLDVIAATTFGALSEGELRLAMDTAAPKNLNPKQLRKWLGERKIAKTKLANELSKMAIELGKGKTTVAEYLAKNASFTPRENVETGNSELNSQDEQALQWAKSNPEDPRSAQILQNLGVKN